MPMIVKLVSKLVILVEKTINFCGFFAKNHGIRCKKGEFLRFELSHNALRRKPQK